MAFLTVDIGASSIKLSVYAADDIRGQALIEDRHRTPANDPNATIEAITEWLGRWVSEQARRKRDGEPTAEPITHLGVCAPGPFNPDTGEMLMLPNQQGWEGFPIKDALRKGTGMPVIIANDGNAAALGEWAYGAGRGARNMVLLTIGTGIGGGVIVNGELLKGASGVAGELGHICINPEGPECGSGAKGCLESYASVSSAIRWVKARLEEGEEASTLEKLMHGNRRKSRAFTGGLLQQAAEAGDPLCLRAFERLGRSLGVGVGSFLNIFNPERVVIAGGFSHAFHLYEHTMTQTAREFSFRTHFEKAEIVVAARKNEAGRLGMLWLLQQETGTGPKRD